ncbi:MAG: hypothetical protein EOP84_17235 [Verrucomicrobiaceae bacterium]|nr:MAG: hypothetical protein EOP84_17235 [Verrucomicrobiaceae bacterium]
MSALDRVTAPPLEQAPPKEPANGRTAVVPPERPAQYMDALSVLRAASDRIRLEVIRELSKGTPIAIRELAKRVGGSADLMSKHIMVLRECGITREVAGTDGRFRFQILAPEILVRIERGERIVDFGSCVLRYPHF